MFRLFAIVLLCAGCAEIAETSDANVSPVLVSDPLEITRVLAADDMEGREAGTAGGEKAREWLLVQMRARPFELVVEDFQHVFEFAPRIDEPTITGVNLIGLIPGTSVGEGPLMVVTAHYDHVGVRGGEVFNGADDNASGVAGALAIADHFFANPPEHDVVIALLDAEEKGLRGAYAMMEDEIIEQDRIALNVNLDMLSKNDMRELYAAGSYHTPSLRPLLDDLALNVPVVLKQGHDRPELGFDDWTLQSDHGVFHRVGIPFVYFGVEDHPDYHQPTDVYETIPEAFFVDSVRTVVAAAEVFDAELSSIETAKE